MLVDPVLRARVSQLPSVILSLRGRPEQAVRDRGRSWRSILEPRWLWNILIQFVQIFLFLYSSKRSNLALMSLKVIAPSLDLVCIYKTAVHKVLAQKDGATVLFDIGHVLLLELEIILCTFVQVTRLANHHRSHLISHVLLPGIESGQRGELVQSLSLQEFDQIHFLCNSRVRLC